MLEQDPQKSCGDTAVINVHFAATAKYRKNMAREIHRKLAFKDIKTHAELNK